MATISLKNLQKKYPGRTGDILALDDVSVELADRSLSVVTGRNGSGKTTLLRAIAGLEEISGGEISIGDRAVTSLAANARDVAMVFPVDALYPAMSVRQNIALGLKLRKFSATEINRRVQDSAQALGVAELLDALPSGLSAVQRQRVALARAVARQPKVLLCDEPLAAFDASTRAQLRAEIRKLHERLETTIVYATADPAEALALGERILVLHEGRVQQYDVAATIYEAPANVVVAGFLGVSPMNLIRGTLKQERDFFLFREAEEGTLQARISLGSAGGDWNGKSVVLGLRPEDVELVQAPKGQEPPDSFPALIDFVETNGAANVVHLQTGAHTIVAQQAGRGPEQSAGRRVRFRFAPDKAHFFDPASGLRLARP